MHNISWLAFSFTLPAKNQAGRMRIWRRLTALGAVIIKNAFYMLPHSPAHHEQFTWLAKEVEELGGDAVYWETQGMENVTSAQIAQAFTQARDADWDALDAELRVLLAQAMDTAPASSPGDAHVRSELEAARRKFARRIEAVAAIDFFPSVRAAAVATLMESLTALAGGKRRDNSCQNIPHLVPANYLGKVWITRKRPYIDRLASFWLVRRFVDASARIAFVSAGSQTPKQDGAVRFDMPEAEFTHVGGLITFEVMALAFGLEAAIPARMRETIRAIDLDGPETGPPEAAGLKRLLDGLSAVQLDDTLLTEQAIIIFDALLASYATP